MLRCLECDMEGTLVWYPSGLVEVLRVGHSRYMAGGWERVVFLDQVGDGNLFIRLLGRIWYVAEVKRRVMRTAAVFSGVGVTR
jgi:hypothetical protein